MDKSKVFSKVSLVILSAFGGALGMYLIIHFFPTKFKEVVSTNTTKVVKDVSITDTGLAEAVDKIYDAVVVVETYKKETKIGSGTGFVYKREGKKGYILTNNHVVSGADRVYVTFTNGKREEAEILGTDSYSDIAVLCISAFDEMKVSSIGSSTSAKVGDTVFAVGAPLDSNTYSWTVTRGILSGKDRMIELSSTNSATSDMIMSAIQTDAAINAGNSGGPLANANGEVIGITSLKLVKNGVEGMGFAIPIETAISYSEKLEKKEKIERPYMGISMYNVSDINSSYYDSDRITAGVYVALVEEGSPAAEAGLEKGDIITKIDDIEVKNVAYLKYNLYKYNAKDKVKFTIYRGTDKKTINMTLGTKEN